MFIYGMITIGYLVVGLFFIKFWTRGRDPLFIIFALAFWLLAASQDHSCDFGNPPRGARLGVYTSLIGFRSYHSRDYS